MFETWASSLLLSRENSHDEGCSQSMCSDSLAIFGFLPLCASFYSSPYVLHFTLAPKSNVLFLALPRSLPLENHVLCEHLLSILLILCHRTALERQWSKGSDWIAPRYFSHSTRCRASRCFSHTKI